MNSVVTDRLADKAMALAQGDDSVFDWLLSLNIVTDPVREDGKLTVTGATGIRVALLLQCDPVNSAVCLGFATAGAYWPMVYPDLLKRVNQKWAAARRAGR